MTDVSEVVEAQRSTTTTTKSEQKTTGKRGTMARSKSASTAAHKHPTYGDMVKRAIVALKEPKGSSRAAILKYIAQNYQVGSNFKMINAHLRLALKRGVAKGLLKQVKGVGASGSFKLSDSKATNKTVKTVKVAKTSGGGGAVKKAKPAKKATKTKSKASVTKKTTKAAKPKAAAATKKITKVSKPAKKKTGASKVKKAAPKKK